MQSSKQSGRQPGNKAIGIRVIYSESEEAAASSASMLGTPMCGSHPEHNGVVFLLLLIFWKHKLLLG